MRYTHTPHPTTYAGVRFRSRLEARWAAFFDLCQWSWEYEPVELAGWAPDFLVTIPCVANGHQLYVEVKPYLTIEDFHEHPVWSMIDGEYSIRPAAFGNSPLTTHFTMWGCASCHDVWDGKPSPTTVMDFVPHWDRLWKDAGNRTQWRRPV
ncbi:MAG: hypothetical protein ACK5QX_11930 [bacterium]|jgi:hypothetical protein